MHRAKFIAVWRSARCAKPGRNSRRVHPGHTERPTAASVSCSLAQSRADRDQVRLACIFEMIPLGAREARRRTSAFEGNANEISVSPNQPASTCRAKIIERKIEKWRHDIEPAQLDTRSVVRDITDTARVNAGVALNQYYRPLIDGGPPLGARPRG